MIATVTGVLTGPGPGGGAGGGTGAESIVIQTDGGVGYRIAVPIGVQERLPPPGSRCTLYTELIVREDSWTLYGFDSAAERTIFQRLLSASGLGPRLALAILSTLGPERTVRSIQGKDLAALGTVSGIGKKRAEKLIVELSDRFADLPATGPAGVRPADEAVRALVALGYSPAMADEAIRRVLTAGGESPDGVPALVRRALQNIGARG